MSIKDPNSPFISLQPIGERIIPFPYLLLAPDEVFGFYGQRVKGTKHHYRLHNGNIVQASRVKVRPDVKKTEDGNFVEITLKAKKGSRKPSKKW